MRFRAAICLVQRHSKGGAAAHARFRARISALLAVPILGLAAMVTSSAQGLAEGGADEAVQAPAPSEPHAAAERDLLAEATHQCTSIGVPADTPELRDCAAGLVRLIQSDPDDRTPSGVLLARADPHVNLGEACLPYFPRESRERHEQGMVVLNMYVDADGRVRGINVRRSSGIPRLDTAAIRCLAVQRWIPRASDGHPVAAWHRVKWTWRQDP
ncbi:MAG: energy transducer TonB [Proteobacteria bacterium]|nr:energy transducer TonB [Pseudomonadota bacterium]